MRFIDVECEESVFSTGFSVVLLFVNYLDIYLFRISTRRKRYT